MQLKRNSVSLAPGPSLARLGCKSPPPKLLGAVFLRICGRFSLPKLPCRLELAFYFSGPCCLLNSCTVCMYPCHGESGKLGGGRSLDFRVGGEVLVTRLVPSVPGTSPPNGASERRPKEIRAPEPPSVPVDQVGTLLGHALRSSYFGLSASLYLQAEPACKLYTIEVQPFSCCSEAGSIGKANNKS